MTTFFLRCDVRAMHQRIRISSTYRWPRVKLDVLKQRSSRKGILRSHMISAGIVSCDLVKSTACDNNVTDEFHISVRNSSL